MDGLAQQWKHRRLNDQRGDLVKAALVLEEIRGADHVPAKLFVVQPTDDRHLTCAEVVDPFVQPTHRRFAQSEGGIRHHRLQVTLDEVLDAIIGPSHGPLALAATERGELALGCVVADRLHSHSPSTDETGICARRATNLSRYPRHTKSMAWRRPSPAGAA